MPTIEVSYKDLCALAGKNIPKETLGEVLLYAKCELDAAEGDLLKLDVKDTNRPDLWSAEGVAREIAGRFGRSGAPRYKIAKPNLIVLVKTRSDVQPLAACMIAHMKINDAFLSQIIQLQEKLSMTLGRNRREMSMGVYDLEKIKLPVTYTSMKPKDIRFVPLNAKKEMSAAEILEHHEKGREFRHLLQGKNEYPVWVDSSGAILSMPPIINSDVAGNISTKTRNVFVECTGNRQEFLELAIDVIAAQVADRKARVESVVTSYGDWKMTTPKLAMKKASAGMDYVRKISGLRLKDSEIVALAERARFDAKISKGKLDVLYPSYRNDIMHARDIVEDIIISFGYNSIEPQSRMLATKGSLQAKEGFSEKIAEICVGLGLQEIMSYMLTNKESQFKKMGLQDPTVIEIDNPVSKNWSVFRTWLIPQLLEFFAANQHVDYPQSVFEIGDVVILDEMAETCSQDVRKLAVGISNSTVSYEDISSVVDAVMRNLGIPYMLMPEKHNSFIDGRCAKIISRGRQIGLAGEVHPKVLNNWGLEKPAVAAELDLDAIMKIRSGKI